MKIFNSKKLNDTEFLRDAFKRIMHGFSYGFPNTHTYAIVQTYLEDLVSKKMICGWRGLAVAMRFDPRLGLSCSIGCIVAMLNGKEKHFMVSSK